MPVTIDHEAQQPEKDTQALTVIPVYNQTAKDLATLEAELKGLVINVETPAGMKEAKKILTRLVKCRTTLESVRKEANQDLIKAKAANDDEAKRINKQVIALEEPIRAQVEKKEAEEAAAQAAKDEADRARLLRLTTAIQDVRDTPASVQGQASNIINGALQRIKATEFDEDDFAEYWQQALDARDAVIGRLTTMLHDQKQHEAEQAQIKADREKLAQLEQEAADRRARDDAEREQREAAEAQQRAVARAEEERLAQVERDRVAAIEEAERKRQADALEEQRQAQARIEAEQEAERVRIAQQQAALAVEIEAKRKASLGLREAAQAVVNDYYDPQYEAFDTLIKDLEAALANEATKAMRKKAAK